MTKQYDKRSIMRKAWDIRRTDNVSMSTALKAAWALAKAMLEAEDYIRENDGSSWNCRMKINDWRKAGRSRTYVNVKVYTNAYNLKHTIQFGYIDNLTGNRVA